jgi:hypothetical protein
LTSVAEVKEELCRVYKSTKKNIFPAPWMKEFRLGLEKVFVPLHLTKRYDHESYYDIYVKMRVSSV